MMSAEKPLCKFEEITTNLLSWYEEQQRYLPWRVPSQAVRAGTKPDPYHVWLSEIMLQQTVVETVKPYYQKFIQIWPNLKAFHNADLEEVLQNWSGLGYYARARNLKICAAQIIERHNGQFPEDISSLKQLKGIGDYTASAIAAIAFQQQIAVVDGNVERIITRVFAIDTILPQAKPIIKEKMQELTPLYWPGNFAQAMMDLGAKICRPKHPLCESCPIQQCCAAFSANEQEKFPVKTPKKIRPHRYGAAFIILSNEGKILLQKRPKTGLLAQMTQIPNYFSGEKLTMVQFPLKGKWHYCGSVTHIFTHFQLELELYSVKITKKDEQQLKLEQSYWCNPERVSEQALPSLFRKILRKVKLL